MELSSACSYSIFTQVAYITSKAFWSLSITASIAWGVDAYSVGSWITEDQALRYLEAVLNIYHRGKHFDWVAMHSI